MYRYLVLFCLVLSLNAQDSFEEAIPGLIKDFRGMQAEESGTAGKMADLIKRLQDVEPDKKSFHYEAYLNLLGEFQLADGQFAAAITTFKKSPAAEQFDPSVWAKIMTALYRSGGKEAVTLEFERISPLLEGVEHADHKMRRLKAHVEKLVNPSVTEFQNTMAEISKGYQALEEQHADLTGKLGPLVEKLKEVRPEKESPYYNVYLSGLGELLLANGQYVEAIAPLKETKGASDYNWGVWNKIIEAVFRSEGAAAAQAEYDRVIAIIGDKPSSRDFRELVGAHLQDLKAKD